MVLLVLMVLPTPEVLPLTALSGLVAAFDLVFLLNLPCRFLLLALTPRNYFPIVERLLIIKT